MISRGDLEDMSVSDLILRSRISVDVNACGMDLLSSSSSEVVSMMYIFSFRPSTPEATSGSLTSTLVTAIDFEMLLRAGGGEESGV